MPKQSSPDKLGIENLIIFCLYSCNKNKETSFEDLTKECFSRFPQIFSLKKYLKWPDARKLDRPLRDLRKRGLIKGDPATNFSLTAKGEKIAGELGKIICQKKLFN